MRGRHGITVMIVEDEPDIADLVSDVLAEEGYLCISARKDPPDRVVGLPDARVHAGRSPDRRVWGCEPGSDTRLVDVHVGRLRKKLEDAKVAEVTEVRIETARGFGYRLVDTTRSARARPFARRARTARASSPRITSVSSHPMHASVTLCP